MENGCRVCNDYKEYLYLRGINMIFSYEEDRFFIIVFIYIVFQYGTCTGKSDYTRRRGFYQR